MAAKKRRKVSKGKTKGEDKYDWLVKKGKEFSKDLINRITEEEAIIKEYLTQLGYKFQFQFPIVANKKHLYILDFLLEDVKVYIEINGSQHYSKEGLKYDRLRISRLKREGLSIIALTNKQAKTFSKEVLDQIIKSELKLLKTVNNS